MTIDLSKECLFQIITWYQEDFEKREDSDDENSDSDDISRGSYKFQQNESKYTIYVFGKDMDEKTYCLKIEDFTPYFYVKVPDHVQKKHLAGFSNWVSDNMWKKNKNCLLRCTLHKKKRFRDFDRGKEYKYIRLVFSNTKAMKNAMGLFQNREYNPVTKRMKTSEKKVYIPSIIGKPYLYELSDNMIDPLLKFIHHKDITTVGWIRLKPGKYFIDEDTNSTCNYNLRTKWTNVKAITEDRDNSKIKVLCYDIECDSSHGDFPVPKKDYLKLARDIYNHFMKVENKNKVTDKGKFLVDCITSAFENGDDKKDIGKVYTKSNVKPHKRVISDVANKLKTYLCLSESSNSIQIKSHNTRCINTLKKYFDDSFPPVEGDRTIQIGISMLKYGEKVPYKNYMLTLGGCTKLDNCKTVSYEREEDLLMQFRNIIQKENPDIITGWNTDGFDTPFLFKRAEELGIEEEFCKMSKFADFESKLKDKQKKGPTGQLIKIEFVDIPGRIQMDLMPLVQKSQNLDSYKLDAVSAEFINGSISKLEYEEETNQTKVYSKTLSGLNHKNFVIFMEIDGYLDEKYMDGKKFEVQEINNSQGYFIVNGNIELNLEKDIKWCLGKDDVSPKDIFRLQKGSDDDRFIIAKYCLMDVVLVLELMNKLEMITNNIGMANVCKTPLSWIIHRGQGVKILSLIAYFLKSRDYVIPLLYKDTFSKEGYEGAVVLDPVPGIYINKPVAVLDFGSLYPSSMIEMNISHETIASDDMYQGEEGSQLLEKLGYGHKDVTYDVYKTIFTPAGAVKGKVKIGEKTVRYVQYADGSKGILPEVLRYLLTSRKNTRTRAKFKNVELNDGTVLTGIYNEEKGIVKDLENEYKIGEQSVVNVKDTFNSFQKNVLDGLQLAFKITANSLYGQVGARTSDIYYKELAASTTAVGRDRLLIAKNFALDSKNYPHKLDNGETIYLKNEIVYGDTDSVFVYFQTLDGKGNLLKGRDARVKAIELGIETEKKIANILDKPQVLEYEKTFDPFVLISKKRYVGMLYETNPDKGKLKSMGIVLKRRDNAPIVKVIYGGIIDIIMGQKNIRPAVTYFRRALRDLVNGKYNIDTLIISKSLNPYYKDPDRIAHKVLADRMAERDPGNKPQVGDRIPFVYIEKDAKEITLQGDRIENPRYIKEHNLKPDYEFYITNQIMKPVTQIFALCLDELPGFRGDIESYKKIYDKEIQKGKSENDSIKKMNEAKRKEAQNILLGDILRVLDNKKRKNMEITHYFRVTSKSTNN